MALSLNDELKHTQLVPEDKHVLYECTKCSKKYKSKHEAQCHIPKCKGRNPEAEDSRFACNTCGKTFATKIGLSQHERHEHPLLRNAARAAEAAKPKEKEC
jgi:DNA-directed RNA polymerase subunit RPC12/RpoP